MKFTEIPINRDAIREALAQMSIDEFGCFIKDLKDFIYSLDDSYYFAKAPVNEIVGIYKNIGQFIATTINALTSILDEKDPNERARGYGHSWCDYVHILRSLRNNVFKNTNPDIIAMVKRTHDFEIIDNSVHQCLKSVVHKLSELISRLQPNDCSDYSDAIQDAVQMKSEYLINSLKDMKPVCDQHHSVKILKMPDDIYNSPKWFFDTSFYHEYVENHEDHDLAKKMIEFRCPVCGNLIIDKIYQKTRYGNVTPTCFCMSDGLCGIKIVCENCKTEMMYGISENEKDVLDERGMYVSNIERYPEDFISYPTKFYPVKKPEVNKRAKPKKSISYGILDSIKLFFVMIGMFLFAAPLIHIVGYNDDYRAGRYVNTICLYIGIFILWINPYTVNMEPHQIILFILGLALIVAAVINALATFVVEWSEIRTALRKED